MNVNYETSTAIQQTTYFNPYSGAGRRSRRRSITSRRSGPANFSIGGTQKQYPGRSEIDRDVPDAQPVVQAGHDRQMRSPGRRASRRATPRASTSTSSETSRTSTRSRRRTASTARCGLGASAQRPPPSTRPIKIFSFTWRNSFQLSDQHNNFPEQDIVYNPAVVDGRDTPSRARSSHRRTTRASTGTRGSICRACSRASGTSCRAWRSKTPIAGAAFMIRTQFTGAEFVTQPKAAAVGSLDVTDVLRALRRVWRRRALPAFDHAGASRSTMPQPPTSATSSTPRRASRRSARWPGSGRSPCRCRSRRTSRRN